MSLRLPGSHRLWPAFPGSFDSVMVFYTVAGERHLPASTAVNPAAATHARLHSSRFGLFPVRSPLLRESRLISFLPGTEMFQFPGLPPSVRGSPGMTRVGLPHSDIDGSTLASSSPSLFAANHVLLRPLTPRHPPCTLHTF